MPPPTHRKAHLHKLLQCEWQLLCFCTGVIHFNQHRSSWSQWVSPACPSKPQQEVSSFRISGSSQTFIPEPPPHLETFLETNFTTTEKLPTCPPSKAETSPSERIAQLVSVPNERHQPCVGVNEDGLVHHGDSPAPAGHRIPSLGILHSFHQLSGERGQLERNKRERKQLKWSHSCQC